MPKTPAPPRTYFQFCFFLQQPSLHEHLQLVCLTYNILITALLTGRESSAALNFSSLKEVTIRHTPGNPHIW